MMIQPTEARVERTLLDIVDLEGMSVFAIIILLIIIFSELSEILQKKV